MRSRIFRTELRELFRLAMPLVATQAGTGVVARESSLPSPRSLDYARDDGCVLLRSYIHAQPHLSRRAPRAVSPGDAARGRAGRDGCGGSRIEPSVPQVPRLRSGWRGGFCLGRAFMPSRIFRAELRELFRLAMPLAAAQAGTQLMGLVDVAVLGRL